MLVGIRNRVKSLVPDGVLLGQLVLRRAKYWREAGLIFIHVPKNGGTSINTAIYGRFMGHMRVRDIERVQPGLLRDLPSLAISRNPWARAYSAYRFARRVPSAGDRVQIRHGHRYRGAAFQSFERFVLEWLPSRRLDREDYVFRPQSHFLLNRQGAVGVGHLGRLEHPESYVGFLEDVLGRSLDIGHLNRSTNEEGYREAFTPQMRDVLAGCYAADVERFGYDF